MISALRFLLDYENIDDDDDSDAESDDDEESKKIDQVVINRQAVYKVKQHFIHIYEYFCH
jgi:protein SDA1